MSFVWENTIIALITLILFVSVGWLIIRSLIRSRRK
ncbi:hypothetical protein J3D43_004467 [Paenibacillus xylanexedens]|nr:hypothetical protein [Paenibacillus xylanexedens]